MQSVPLVLNYKKLLFEDKKQVVLDFTKVKLCRFTPEEEYPQLKSEAYLVFRAIVNYCDSNAGYNMHGNFINLNKFGVSDIKVACEAAKLKPKQDQEADEWLAKQIQTLEQDPSVKFLKKIGQADDKKGSLYQVNWQAILEVARNTFVENLIE